MTDREAIEYIKAIKGLYHTEIKEVYEALDKAIEAIKENEKLKQELKEVKQELTTFKALC